MKKNAETISDDNGVELLIGYQYEAEKDYYEEPGNPFTLVKGMVYTELTSVEVVIKGKGIDILPQLNDRQKEYIICQLTYEE